MGLRANGSEATHGTLRQTHHIESPNLLRHRNSPKRSPQERLGVRIRILFLVLPNLIARRVAVGKGIAPLRTPRPSNPPSTAATYPAYPKTRRDVAEFKPSTLGNHLEGVAAEGLGPSSLAGPPSVAFGVSILRALKIHLILPAWSAAWGGNRRVECGACWPFVRKRVTSNDGELTVTSDGKLPQMEIWRARTDGPTLNAMFPNAKARRTYRTWRLRGVSYFRQCFKSSRSNVNALVAIDREPKSRMRSFRFNDGVSREEDSGNCQI